jgi:hypothetical protein
MKIIARVVIRRDMIHILLVVTSDVNFALTNGR